LTSPFDNSSVDFAAGPNRRGLVSLDLLYRWRRCMRLKPRSPSICPGR
jgi:hypothetical protein